MTDTAPQPAQPTETSTDLATLEVAQSTVTDQLAALGTAGAFVEARISRGAVNHGEREASDTLIGQLVALAPQISAGTPGLPADALDRLKSVSGIGDALAQKALDALTQ
ncbi:hypothetical protein [Deinococcus sp. QL22]|uniref:hypothetical protein n=1 Tax=Deinococcus sp. QL22 TaxID=2939437 RepID=UPI00201711D1|nr:hypothetical protein [Deinococcus sp. QL22]UQN06771.1 hypothetical protein M1R55_02285 [Deinococcus sp. QL22]